MIPSPFSAPEWYYAANMYTQHIHLYESWNAKILLISIVRLVFGTAFGVLSQNAQWKKKHGRQRIRTHENYDVGQSEMQVKVKRWEYTFRAIGGFCRGFILLAAVPTSSIISGDHRLAIISAPAKQNWMQSNKFMNHAICFVHVILCECGSLFANTNLAIPRIVHRILPKL